jgi:hypothetical protein
MPERFHFFYNGPFSQWLPAPFVVDGVHFKTAEAYMMWAKDWIFGGGAQESAILSANHPAECKRLGRMVANFDPEIWSRIARSIVFRGNIAKFTQNEFLLEELLATQGTTLVEASPVDKIWGIGLDEDDSRAQARSTWLGKNWLGETLTEVRAVLAR